MKLKFIIGFLIMLTSLGVIKAENPTIIVPGTGISVSPASGVGRVTVSATGGGGGAGTITNVTSSVPWQSASGVGTPTINLSTNTTKIPIGNVATGFGLLSGNNIWTGANTFSGGLTFDFLSVTNLQVIASVVDASSTNIFSSDHYLWDANNNRRYDVSNGTIYDENFKPAIIMTAANRNLRTSGNNVVVDWKNGLFNDLTASASIDANNRTLTDISALISADYNNRLLNNTWTVRGSLVINTNLTVLGNVISPLTLASNLTVNTMMGINTNVVASAWNADDFVFWARPNPNSGVNTTRMGILGTDGSQFMMTDGATELFTMGYRTAGSIFRFSADGATFQFNASGTTIMQASASTVTMGASASSAVTMNNSTLAIPNNLTVASGGLFLPSSTSGTSTNGYSVNTFTGATSSYPNGNLINGVLWWPNAASGTYSNSISTNVFTGAMNFGGTLNTTSNIIVQPGTGITGLAVVDITKTNQVVGETTLITRNYSSVNIAQQTQLRARGTIASPTAIQLNDTLGGYSARGHTGSAFTADAFSFVAKAAQIWNPGSNGTYGALFLTQTNLAASTIAERFRWTADRGGSYGIATNTPDAALHVGLGTVAGVAGAGVAHFDGGLIVGATGTGVLTTISGATNFLWTPGSVGAASTVVTNMSVAGVTQKSVIEGSHNQARAGLVWDFCCTNDGVITASIFNITAGGIDPGVHTNQVRYFTSP